MKDLKLQGLSARVVAWHNRHPLARRITAAQVHSVGYVVLPYWGQDPGAAAAPAASAPPEAAVSTDPHGGATLRERAMARAQGAADAPGVVVAAAAPSAAPAPAASRALPATRGRLTPAFTEDFIAPLAPALVGRWAADHGMALVSARTDAPVRQVAPGSPLDVTRLQPLWVLTAQLEVGRARTRVLVGAGDDGQPPAVLGRRLWSPARCAVLAAVPVLLVVLVLLVVARVGLRGSAPLPEQTLPPLAAAGAAASAADVPPAAASAPSAVESAAADGAKPARPVDVEPTLGRVDLPPIGPRADERRRAADQARQPGAPGSATAPGAPGSAAAPGAPGSAAAPASEPAPKPAPAASTPPTPLASTGPAFAVSTRVLRTRTEGEQVAAAMRALLVTPATPGTPPMRVEVMPVGEDWRVVGWPYADRALAEKARALLAARGMKVQVIDF